MTDHKFALRQLEFPLWAGEALIRIEQLLAGRNVPSSKQIELANDLMKEFIFCECDMRGAKRPTGLDALEELHVLDVLCEYFSGSLNETARNAIFLSLFGGPDASRRIKVLCKLASMAITASVAPVLNVVGVWLQQTGCSSNLSIQLARSLVRDYFILHPNHDGILRNLPNVAPHFVTNFVAAIVEIYLKDGPEGTFSPPPKNLLEIITTWVCSDPKICHTTQLSATAFPSGGIPMSPVSPLTGLIQWCTLAPLYLTSTESNDCRYKEIIPQKKIKLEHHREVISLDNQESPSEFDLYGKLHLGVLQSLYEGRKLQGSLTAVNAQNLSQIVAPILYRKSQMQTKENSVVTDAKLQTCLNRISQAIQIALSSNCVYGNVPKLLSTLEGLPENRMLRIVIKTYRQQIHTNVLV